MERTALVSLAQPEPGLAATSHAPGPPTTALSGWGANAWAECALLEPESEGQLSRWLDRRGSIARGLGRSYGDAAVNAGGQVLGMTRFNRYLAFDEANGVLTCEAGVSLAQLIHHFAPRGWFPMITPGTKFVTIGGAIANDVHGKGHHAQGSFSTSVEAMSVLLANGEVVRASRHENADLFWASFGGMGLLGVILSVELRLRRIDTTYFSQKVVVVKNLEAMLAAFDEHDQTYPYSVATLDVFATGARLGSGVVAFGDHATREQLPARLARDPLRIGGDPKLDVPFKLPELTLNKLSIRLVNAFVMQVQKRGAAFGHYDSFVYPLDMLAHWNRGYGRRGFTQYQFVIPLANGLERMREILRTILSSGELPFLNVLKRLGKQSEGVLSFPREGYTFAIDFPIRNRTTQLLARLDRLVLDAGGRVYLGKDSFLDADTFRAMYPDVDRFLAIKQKYDPSNVFTSDLARRVGLTPAATSRELLGA